MNKRLNSVLFILGATVINIVVMMIIFFTALILFARFLAPSMPVWANQVALMVIFVGSVVGTYFLYHKAMRFLAGKVEMQKYFGPLFGRRERRDQ